MKIIERGNNTIKCERCGCVIEYDSKDIQSAVNYMKTSSFFDTRAYYKWEYIDCPQCGLEITVRSRFL